MVMSEQAGRPLRGFARQAALPGSVILTSGWKGYDTLSHCGYTRKKTVLSDSGDPAHVALPAVHYVWLP